MKTLIYHLIQKQSLHQTCVAGNTYCLLHWKIEKNKTRLFYGQHGGNYFISKYYGLRYMKKR